MAQPAAAQTQGMLEFVVHHFQSMLPILVMALFGAVIIVERLRALFLVYPLSGTHAFFERVRNLVMADRIGEAVALCERYRSKPTAYVVKEGLMRAHQPTEIIEHGLDIAANEAMERVKARTPYLSMIANVATLLGLIGTIFGLITSFNAVGSAEATQKAALLAQGISEAMNHTLWGLSVAVPCMVLFSLLMNRTNKIKSEIERAVVRTADILRQRYVMTGEPDHHHPEGHGGGAPGHQAQPGAARGGYRRAV